MHLVTYLHPRLPTDSAEEPKILAFNGSPRLKGNSATMLEHAINGARAQGAEVELFNLYKMQFSGCISCFSCKRLGEKRSTLCAVKDDLRPVLEKVVPQQNLWVTLGAGRSPSA